MKNIDDLSWSNIVDIVQHNDKEGAKVLDNLAKELEVLRKKIIDAESKVYLLKSRESLILSAAKDVAYHLKKEIPLVVQRKGYIVVLSEENLSIGRNVL